MNDYIELVKAVVPLVQSILYVGAVILLLWRFRDDARLLLDALKKRVSGGASLSFGMVSIGAAPSQSQVSDIEITSIASDEQTDDVKRMRAIRETEYQRTHGFYIYHALIPTREVGQKYSVGVFIGKHIRKEQDRSGPEDIESAKFFLGPYWKNEIFSAEETRHGYGFATNAFGEFLVICEMKLKDGSVITLSRYVDFKGPEISIVLSS